MDDMRARDHVGRQRYGVPLQTHNGRDALVDLYQELLDSVVYIKQVILERDRAQAAVRPVAEDEPARLSNIRAVSDDKLDLTARMRRMAQELADEHGEAVLLFLDPPPSASGFRSIIPFMALESQVDAGNRAAKHERFEPTGKGA